MAWGTGSFENDEGAAWLKNLHAIMPEDLTRILEQAADDPAYLEAPAARRGGRRQRSGRCSNRWRPSEISPPETLTGSGNMLRAFPPELKAVAIRALDRVRRNSELKDLWLEADGSERLGCGA